MNLPKPKPILFDSTKINHLLSRYHIQPHHMRLPSKTQPCSRQSHQRRRWPLMSVRNTAALSSSLVTSSDHQDHRQGSRSANENAASYGRVRRRPPRAQLVFQTLVTHSSPLIQSYS